MNSRDILLLHLDFIFHIVREFDAYSHHPFFKNFFKKRVKLARFTPRASVPGEYEKTDSWGTVGAHGFLIIKLKSPRAYVLALSSKSSSLI